MMFYPSIKTTSRTCPCRHRDKFCFYILKEHRATPDGDSYIPDPCVADYNQKYGTDYKVGDIDFDLSPSAFA